MAEVKRLGCETEDSERAMRFRTENRVYTLRDAGDGGFLISGHPKYCPVPTLVQLVAEPRIGDVVMFEYVTKRPLGVRGRMVITTPVVEITPVGSVA